MPELIEKGYLYIAQPPLYKVARGKSSVYLKDETAMEEYLIEQGLEDAVLTLANGEQRSGQDLLQLVNDARHCRDLINNIARQHTKAVLEQVAIAGALNDELLSDADKGPKAAAFVAERLDAMSSETERGWVGEILPDFSLKFSREVRGVTGSTDPPDHLPNASTSHEPAGRHCLRKSQASRHPYKTGPGVADFPRKWGNR